MDSDNNYVTIPIEMSDQDFLMIAKMAHEYDITFNKMIEKIIIEHLPKLDQQQ